MSKYSLYIIEVYWCIIIQLSYPTHNKLFEELTAEMCCEYLN